MLVCEILRVRRGIGHIGGKSCLRAAMTCKARFLHSTMDDNARRAFLVDMKVVFASFNRDPFHEGLTFVARA